MVFNPPGVSVGPNIIAKFGPEQANHDDVDGGARSTQLQPFRACRNHKLHALPLLKTGIPRHR